jgi:hypothetical protein
MTMHYRQPEPRWSGLMAACGRMTACTTDDPESVTCGACKRTRAWWANLIPPGFDGPRPPAQPAMERMRYAGRDGAPTDAPCTEPREEAPND